MLNKEKYQFTDIYPEWIKEISSEELVFLSQENDDTLQMKNMGRGICYFHKEIIKTSSDENDTYRISSWNLSNPQLLQAASVREIFLGDNDNVEIYRFGVIRNNVFIDKKNELIVRLLDDEASSHQGSIHKISKLHMIMGDLQLNDTLVLEYLIVTSFTEKNSVDRDYFRCLYTLSEGYWFYKKYNFEVIQNRKESLKLIKKYFRNDTEDLLPEEEIILKNGETFSFEQENFQITANKEYISPYFEIATDTNWPAITKYMKKLYLESCADVTDKQIYSKLELENDEDRAQKIRKIIEYVQDEIVYVYDAEVMKGHIPESPDKTLKSKSGDCKSKTLLLIQLLRSIGVDAQFCFVNYQQDYFIPLSIPSPFVFNHVIARINYNNKEYFIDSTVSDRKGTLENRSEPFFAHYLPIDISDEQLGNPTRENQVLLNLFGVASGNLITKSRRTASDFPIETNTSIYVKKGKGRIIIEKIYRREIADKIRLNFKHADQSILTKEATEGVFFSMELGSNGQEIAQKSKEMILDVQYSLVMDDRDENCIKTRYEATLPKPYHIQDHFKIVKFYNYMTIEEIINFKHEDILCTSFFTFPRKDFLLIESDLCVERTNEFTKQNTKIDNPYFSFSNEKKISMHTVQVSSQYIPKSYGYIQAKDLDDIKKDSININNSNYGVGVVYMSLWRYILSFKSFIVIAFIIAFRILAHWAEKQGL